MNDRTLKSRIGAVALRGVLLMSAYGWSALAFGFETQTHVGITKVAYDRSILAQQGPGSVSEILGFDRLNPKYPFRKYWDSLRYLYVRSDESPLALDSPLAEPELFEQCNIQMFNRGDREPAVDFRVFNNVALEQNNRVYPVANWLIRGAVREDDLGSKSHPPHWCDIEFSNATMGEQYRVFRHFYDPAFNRGVFTFQKSIDWGLGYVDALPLNDIPTEDAGRENGFTYVDARNAYWWALTAQSPKPESMTSTTIRAADAERRLYLWATTFRALGNVIHLLQDAGQPQHTRNDAHSPLHSDERSAFEGYTNVRMLQEKGSHIGVNAQMRAFLGGSDATLDAPPAGNYPAVEFATPVRFFTTRRDNVLFDQRSGLADYSNRGFFTGGTLPGSDYAMPPQDVTSAGYTVAERDCLGIAAGIVVGAVTCKHYLRAVPDPVAPTYSDTLPPGFSPPSVPIAAESIWKELVPHGEVPPQVVASMRTTLGPEQMNAIGNLAIPRAIGYSAGFINFFFRGRLQISAPPGGVFAAADQGTPHTISDGIPIETAANRVFGFKALRLRVQNATHEDMDRNGFLRESGTGHAVKQSLGSRTGSPDAKLVAIARYHRSGCYRPDLSGEMSYLPTTSGTPSFFVPSGCDNVAERTRPIEISVSAPKMIDATGGVSVVSGACSNINKGPSGGACASSPALLEFDFSADPIPINASDLFIQVAYRGAIGDELDGIAVGSFDVREPSFMTVANSADYYLYRDELLPFASVPFPPRPAPEAQLMTEALVCVEGQRVAHHAVDPGIPPPGFHRVALITDPQTHSATTRVWFTRGESPPHASHVLGQIHQSDRDDPVSGYDMDPLKLFRGTPLGMFGHTIILNDPGSTITPQQQVQLSTSLPRMAGPRGEGLPVEMTSVGFPQADARCGVAGPMVSID